MKAILQSVLSVFIVLVCLVACTGSPQSNASSPDSGADKASFASSSSEPNESAEDFVNMELLSFIKGTNGQLKAWRDEKCVAINVGAATDELEYFYPYINVYYVSWRGHSGLSDRKDGLTTDIDVIEGTDVTYPSNPYEDGQPIRAFYLRADYDSAKHAVTNQDSLRQLFSTQDTITYGLLCEKLQQQPALTHDENASVYTIVPYEHDAGIRLSVQGGMYETTFYLDAYIINIGFVKIGEEYTALSLSAMVEDSWTFI